MNASTKRLGVLLALVIALGALVGCAGASLNGTKWTLTGWTLDSLKPDAYGITADFADGKISGSSGVNSYGGTYTAGPGSAFAVSELASTLMASADADRNAAEQAFTKLLTEAKGYRLSGTTLTLLDAAGNDSLIFSRDTK